MNENTNETEMNYESVHKKHSTWTILSFSCLAFGLYLSNGLIYGRIIYFYQAEILLPIEMVSLAWIIYTLWNTGGHFLVTG